MLIHRGERLEVLQHHDKTGCPLVDAVVASRYVTQAVAYASRFCP